jgi:hypothetical protein
MSSHSEGCRANARRCLEIAGQTWTAEDKGEFLTFAAAWQRLAKEIEFNERLISLIDGLAISNTMTDTAKRLDAFSGHSNSLRRLATAIFSVSSHFAAGHFASGVRGFDQPE